MAYPSHIARSALRSALRNHPNSGAVLSGRLVNTLTLDELKASLRALGENPDTITAGARSDAVLAGYDRAYPAKTVFCARCDSASVDGCTDPGCPHLSHDEEEDRAEAETEAPEAPDPVEAEVQTIRSLIVTGGFSALDARLRELVTEARKPAVEVFVPMVPMIPGQTGPVAKLTGQTATWRQLFSVRSELGKNDCQLWDGAHPSTPAVNSRYIWPHPETETALSQIKRGRNVMLYGPAGTGKTEFAGQLAALTGRPFALISCDNGTEASTLVGLTVPDAAGGVTWQDGQLTQAISTPGCVICLDEPSVARPGALMVMQNVLQNRELFISETGRRVRVAKGVIFLATDNTNGTGGGARHGYTDTNRLNAAFLDRYGVRVKIDYLPPAAEASVIVEYTGCTMELARLLVQTAAVTRAAAADQTLSHGIGLRRLLSWAELLTDGIDPETAFASAVLNTVPEADVETLREQCLLSYDKATVARALAPTAPAVPDPAIANPTPAGRSAASDFNQI